MERANIRMCPASTGKRSTATGLALLDRRVRLLPAAAGCGAPSCSLRASRAAESIGVLNRHRRHITSRRESQHLPVERELGIGHLDDGLGLAKAVLLACEGEIRQRDAVGAESLRHRFRLSGWDHGVLEALEE